MQIARVEKKMSCVRSWCAVFFAVTAILVLAERSRAQTEAPDSPSVSAASSEVVVTGEEVPSAYGAPPGFSRTRTSPLTTAYVLPPWAFFFGTIYEGQAFKHGPPDHLFTQEVEMGLPYRFGLAAETSFERFNGGGNISSVIIEGRYAL